MDRTLLAVRGVTPCSRGIRVSVYSTLGAPEQRGQQPTDGAVAIQEWVDGLELDLRKRRPDEHRQTFWLSVKEPLEPV